MRQPFAVKVSRRLDSGHVTHGRDDSVDVAVGETEQVQAGPRPRRAVQRGDVRLLAFLVEAVVQRAVDDGVEAPFVPAEGGGVGDVEIHCDVRGRSATARLLDRGG
jgi:hypothetical protein